MMMMTLMIMTRGGTVEWKMRTWGSYSLSRVRAVMIMYVCWL